MVLMREGECEGSKVERGSEKGVPLSITILYGTPHAKSSDTIRYINLE